MSGANDDEYSDDNAKNTVRYVFRDFDRQVLKIDCSLETAKLTVVVVSGQTVIPTTLNVNRSQIQSKAPPTTSFFFQSMRTFNWNRNKTLKKKLTNRNKLFVTSSVMKESKSWTVCERSPRIASSIHWSSVLMGGALPLSILNGKLRLRSNWPLELNNLFVLLKQKCR